MKNTLFIILITLIPFISNATQRVDVSTDLKTEIYQAGMVAFIDETNIVSSNLGISYERAKEIVWQQVQNRDGKYYDEIMERFVWRPWMTYTSLFFGGCAAGYLLC